MIRVKGPREATTNVPSFNQRENPTDNCSDAVASEMRRDRAISWIRRGHALSVSSATNVTRCWPYRISIKQRQVAGPVWPSERWPSCAVRRRREGVYRA